MMVLAFILSIGIITVQSFATSDNVSPLQQWNNGTPITGIQCSNDLILLQSPSGKPACVTQETSIKLEQRGYAIIKSADMVTESSTTEQGLMRGPAPTPIRGSIIDGATELNLSYEQLIEQKESGASGASGQSNEFNPIRLGAKLPSRKL